MEKSDARPATSKTGKEVGPYGYMVGLGIAGLAASALAVLLASAEPLNAAAFAASLSVVVLALAAACIGGLAGFLFGVPKLLAGQEDESPEAGTKSASTVIRRYVGNTNLESVSDWLTKAIIGVGLVELQEIPRAIWTAASSIATAAPGTPAVSIVAAMGVLGFLWGFAIVYLYARTGLLRAMTSAENDAAAASRELDSLGEGVHALLEDHEAEAAADADAAGEGEHDEQETPGPPQGGPEPGVELDGNRRDRAYWTRKAMEATTLVEKIPTPTPAQLRGVAAICRLANWMDEASNIYHQLIKVNEGLGGLSPEDRAFPYEQLGHVAQQRKQYVEADTFFEQALQQNPKSLHIVYARARNAALAGDTEQATALLSQVLDKKPAFKARAKRDHALRRVVSTMRVEQAEALT